METKFNFNSQVCTDKIQSERLLELGLKPEIADMSIICKYVGCDDDGVLIYEENIYPYPPSNERISPAWSLHRLVEMISEEIQTDWESMCLQDKVFTKRDNLYDNLIDCIGWLIKERYFLKEYLEERK